MMTEQQASAVVDAIFEDLRDRQFLKWLFCDDPDHAGPIMYDSQGRALMPLDSDVQAEIRDAWKRILMQQAK